MTSNEIKVGSGSVALVDVMGSPLSVVNAARVSMGKRAEKMEERDWKLVKYLWDHHHTSPFRHVFFQFHVKAPIFVLRQWQKHQVGCSWNEISGRYVELGQDYWKPRAWREASESVKQGSGGELPREVQLGVHHIYADALNTVATAYELLLQMGVCKEQARAILPVSVMSECYWSCSLHALIHFLKLRLDEHAQLEIREYAQAVSELVESIEGMDRVLEVCLG